MGATKITTCCYCGNRAALVLRGKERHELSCNACGAPLHAMKMLPKDGGGKKRSSKPPKHDDPRAKKEKKRKSFGSRVVSGLWDVIEDVVDEVFD
ncbi:hypothetical protein [Yoonia sp. BS5-3]|uniref:Uncharacterized protein n=1 Tax=Yoonia phaeophyticola TaxID=3137369 RepID=A0ABZ2V2D6_9RHOB